MPYSIGETLKALADDPHFKEFMQGTQDVLRGAGAAIASAPVETVRAPYSIAESMYKGYFGREPQISTENTPGGFQDIRQRMGGKDTQTKAETAGSILGSFADPVLGGAKILGAAASTIPLMAGFKGAARELGPMSREAGIVGAKEAKGLKYETKPIDHPVIQEAVKNTPNAQLTEDGLLLRVQRNQRPEQGQMESVRGGVFYLPEGASQAKHYSTGKVGYGGSEKISGETLLRAPLIAKGGTGGKAPEAAYDQLLGKGSYEKMRKEALKSFGPYGSSQSHKASLADEFLDKYAPELSGYGSYIVENSKHGNQLAYALQEAAVASAVRKAGYDSVVGYSKGKSGPFISEIFDVRESHYPDKFGFSRVHEQYEP